MNFEIKLHGQPLTFVKTKHAWVCTITDFAAGVLLPHATETDREANYLFLESSIDTLELSRRAANCLRAENIYTLRDLVNTEASYIRYRIPNLGVTTYIEIVKSLAQYGLKLKGELR